MGTNKALCKGNESGQALVVVVLFLLGLLAILALVLDGGNLYLQRRRMQNAADAGALAGARVLALGGTQDQARAAAYEYAVQRNGAATCQIAIDASGIEVVAGTYAPMTFARLLGVNQLPVSAQARAALAPVAGGRGVAPIAIRDFNYIINGPTYTIWDDEVDSGDPAITYKISGSYRGWLNLDCVYPASCGAAGADLRKEWMRTGYPGLTQANTWIRGSSGVSAAVIQEAAIGQLLKIPVYDMIQDKYSNQSYYHVIKFAAFRVTAYVATGSVKGIQGVFEYYFTPSPPGSGPDGGWRTINLTK